MMIYHSKSYLELLEGTYQPARVHPILMSSAMMHANLSGNKSVTRRTSGLNPVNKQPLLWKFDELTMIGYHLYAKFTSKTGATWFAKCPYGEVGDYLWVRESFRRNDKNQEFAYKVNRHEPNPGKAWDSLCFTDTNNKFKTSLHMPREASRMLLQVKSISIERLGAITETEINLEGIRPAGIADDLSWQYLNYVRKANKPRSGPRFFDNPMDSFISLWGLLHPRVPWASGKEYFVWRVEYEIVYVKN